MILCRGASPCSINKVPFPLLNRFMFVRLDCVHYVEHTGYLTVLLDSCNMMIEQTPEANFSLAPHIHNNLATNFSLAPHIHNNLPTNFSLAPHIHNNLTTNFSLAPHIHNNLTTNFSLAPHVRNNLPPS